MNNDVGSCRKVTMMPSCVVGGGEDCWSFVWFDDGLIIPLWISPPKAAILQEEVRGIADKCSISFLSEISWLAQGSELIMDMSQTLICFVRFVRSGEGGVGQRSGHGRISLGTIIVNGIRCKSCAKAGVRDRLPEWVKKVHKSIHLVDPIIEVWVICGV